VYLGGSSLPHGHHSPKATSRPQPSWLLVGRHSASGDPYRPMRPFTQRVSVATSSLPDSEVRLRWHSPFEGVVASVSSGAHHRCAFTPPCTASMTTRGSVSASVVTRATARAAESLARRNCRPRAHVGDAMSYRKRERRAVVAEPASLRTVAHQFSRGSRRRHVRHDRRDDVRSRPVRSIVQ
jgi:hypothetical protein